MFIGQIVDNRYKVIKIIGSGSFGETGIATDTKFPGKPLRAVKQLCPKNDDPKALIIAERLFETEAKCLAKLGEHDRIPRLFAYLEENEAFFLVQELIEGQNLTNEFQPGKKWSEEETVKFLQELLSVLSVVHQENVIHRDLKPANIMRRDRDAKLVLIDFGAVKEILTVDRNGKINTIIDSTCIIGTPPYMSPEQAVGQPKKCSDVYAVGILSIQALTGLSASDLFVPLDSEGLQHIWQNSNIEVSDKLKSILEKMISFQYKQRFPDAAAALNALAPDESNDRSRTRSAIALQAHNRFADATEAFEVLNPTESEIPTLPMVSNTSQPETEPTIINKSFPKKLLLGMIGAIALISGVGVYLAQTFNKPDYTQLETYLENQQWRKADEETDKIILGIAREPSELDTQSANKFPCKVLNEIDLLWTTNSKGRFGFTPQKQIYLETGNKFGEYAESMYKDFGDRVGWRPKILGLNDWHVYDDLKFDNPSLTPVGHFPSPGKKIDQIPSSRKETDPINIRHDEREKLLSRFDKCGL